MFIFSTLAMSSQDLPVKPRRKKLEVPIHHQRDDERITSTDLRKSFSANFNPKKSRQRHEIPKITIESPDSQKPSRKHLAKENSRLSRENEEITLKFNELEELSVRKITKLREKVSALHTINDEVANENNFLKGQNQELISTLDDFRLQLELSKHCKNCDEYKSSLEQICNENNRLKTTNKELDEDVNMLKTVVFRLNQHMERYQEKLRNLNIKFAPPQYQNSENLSVVEDKDIQFLSDFHKDHSHTPISWGKVNVHTLGPLLDAYQDTITEKDAIIQNYETEISNFTGKLKEIMKENELLHKNLTEDDDCSAKLKNEVEKLKKEVKILKEQNDILIKKCALKQDKLEEVLRCYEQKVEVLKRDYSVLHDEYCKSRTEVAALREKNKALVDAQDDFKNERQNYIPVSVHTSSVNECKKWYEELKHQYEQEKTKIRENLETQEKLVEDLRNKNSELTRSKDDLEKQVKKHEAKMLEMEHALNEAQFSRTACRKQLNKAMNFAKDLVAEQETLLKALNQRQQENKAVKKIGCDIATRMDSLRNQLKDVQRDAWQELTTVEKRIQEQNDVIETMKQEHVQEIERLQKIIKEQEGSNLVLKEQAALPTSQYLLFRDKHK